MGYDNTFVINQVHKILPIGSNILELGMGTGIDLIALAKDYNVIGSDSSNIFVEDFKRKVQLPVLVLDAVDIVINQKFDCIFSNKVLQHLSKDEFIKSLNSQHEHLNDNGIIFATLWVGEYREEFEFNGQLRFVYYNESILKKIIPKHLELQKVIYYSEFKANDSLIIVLSKK